MYSYRYNNNRAGILSVVVTLEKSYMYCLSEHKELICFILLGD